MRFSCSQRTIFTIGHSTRSVAEFVALSREVEVDFIADVRSFPRSRAMPQFDIETLPSALATDGIGYRHFPALGGRRHHAEGAPPSTNRLWRVLSFRNYADYAETAAFRSGLDELLTLSLEHRCAIMCAEAVWWRCHRRIIADYLLACGTPVEHIMGLDKLNSATITPGARVMADATLRYPSQ